MNDIIFLVVLVGVVLLYSYATTYVLPKLTFWWVETKLFRLRSEIYNLSKHHPELLKSPFYQMVEADICLKISIVRARHNSSITSTIELISLFFQSTNSDAGELISDPPSGFRRMSDEEYIQKLFPAGGSEQLSSLAKYSGEDALLVMAMGLVWGNQQYGPLVWLLSPIGVAVIFIVIAFAKVGKASTSGISDLSGVALKSIENNKRLQKVALPAN
ncbi:MAG: hypothetical protein V3V10_09265 [Planctomycetota bacterium]